MSKTLKNVFNQNLTYIKLYQAHIRASRNKRNRKDVILFEMDLESNLMNLCKHIQNGTYKMGKYREFIIYEPKMRIIESLPYIDRVVHQWYVEEFIIPFFLPRFIKDTYSCIKERGTHKSLETLQKYMRIMKRKYGHYYILKCDIQKFFSSIKKDILYKILSNYISDRKLIEFTRNLIYDDSDYTGIPIGNYTSQFFANIYLNEFDHYIKEVLKIKYYVRYMDDFILLVSTKEEAKGYLKDISNYLQTHLELKLNKKSRYYPNELGVDFCGFKVYETHKLVRKRSIQKIKKIIRLANHDVRNNRLNFQYIRSRYNSWLAHVHHANSYHLVNKYHDMFIISERLDK